MSETVERPLTCSKLSCITHHKRTKIKLWVILDIFLHKADLIKKKKFSHKYRFSGVLDLAKLLKYV